MAATLEREWAQVWALGWAAGMDLGSADVLVHPWAVEWVSTSEAGWVNE